MGSDNRLNYTACSDQELLRRFHQRTDRHAVSELYQRYSAAIGRFLLRDIRDKSTVTEIVNSLMERLLAQAAEPALQQTVSIKLFAMAYAKRRAYIKADCRRGSNSVVAVLPNHRKVGARTGRLQRHHHDVLELLYLHNFSFVQAAQIMGCSQQNIKNYWYEAKSQYLPRKAVS